MTFKALVDGLIASMSLPAKIIALAFVGYLFVRSFIRFCIHVFKKDRFSDLDAEVKKLKKLEKRREKSQPHIAREEPPVKKQKPLAAPRKKHPQVEIVSVQSKQGKKKSRK